MKLARLLGCPDDELAYLERVPVEDLRRLREQVTELLFDSHGAVLGRLAAASRILPVGVVALIAEQAFGPVLAARIAGRLEPQRAAEVAERLPTRFLADVAVHLDPRRTSDLLRRIPPARIADAARELVAAREYVTLGRFVAHLPDESVAPALREMDDGTLLRVAFVLEDLSTIDHVLNLMDPGRLDRLLEAAMGTELWPEALELFGQVQEPLRSRILASRALPGDAASSG